METMSETITQLLVSLILLGIVVILSAGLFAAAVLQALAPEPKDREYRVPEICVRKLPAWYGELGRRRAGRRVG